MEAFLARMKAMVVPAFLVEILMGRVQCHLVMRDPIKKTILQMLSIDSGLTGLALQECSILNLH